MLEKIRETARWIESRITVRPRVAVVLGTGLGSFADELTKETEIAYKDIPNFPVSTVEGHAGKLIVGKLGKTDVIALDGRFHYYEGYTMKEVTFPVRVFGEMGVKTLLLSNAAGGVNPDFKVGTLMVITDHINFLPEHPLRGKNLPLGPRFPDMSEAYDKELIVRADKIAQREGIEIKHGVYLANSGPTYETPAEYKMYRILGADAVGMSTVPEVIVAVHQGMKVFAMSIITDMGIAETVEKVTHEAVQAVAANVQPCMKRIFSELIEE